MTERQARTPIGTPPARSTKASLLVGAVVAGAAVAALGLALDVEWLALLGLIGAVAAAGALAASLLATERRRDEAMKEELEQLAAEHARLSDQLITAEQEERRRLALFLHDGAVQSLSGIALMLDAIVAAVEAGKSEDAKSILRSALEKQRETIRSLRDLSFELEPVVLRDQGFGPAVRALAEQVGMANRIEIDLEVDGADTLAERAQVAIYQIVRETLHQAIRRGPPTRISVRVAESPDGGVEAVIADNGAGERRRASFDEIAERARSLGGQLSVDAGTDGGTAVRVVFPPYTVRR
ncbi:MAG TPA: histidine kinase [Gaiellaceae bacterium]|nr:histidine kinase [Gaiellaceae bacterium]